MNGNRNKVLNEDICLMFFELADMLKLSAEPKPDSFGQGNTPLSLKLTRTLYASLRVRGLKVWFGANLVWKRYELCFLFCFEISVVDCHFADVGVKISKIQAL